MSGLPPNTFTTALTETSVAEQFVAVKGGEYRFHRIEGRWLRYNGVAWRRDHKGAAVEDLKTAISELVHGALEDGDATLAKRFLDFHGRRRLMNVLDLASSIQARNGVDPSIPVVPAELDANPYLFNTLTHTIDLRTGAPRPHDPGDLITKVAPVRYDPEARCPTWLSFLDRIFAGNEALIGAVQRLLGSCLVGEIRENVFPIFWGSGANGKSTLITVKQKLMGEYAATIKADVLLERHLDPQGFQLADLPGVRMVTAVETDSDGKLNEALVKAMTGRDRIKVAQKYGQPFEFVPVFKPILVTNHKPGISGQDHAIWRRVTLFPFEVEIPKAEQDLDLPNRLIAGELAGILNWLIGGCFAWLRDGYNFPKEVVEATKQYREESDPLHGWIEARCELGPGLSAKTNVLYDDFLKYCKEIDEPEVKKAKFSRTLTERGIGLNRMNSARLRDGIALRSAVQAGDTGSQAEMTEVTRSQIQSDALRPNGQKVLTRARENTFPANGTNASHASPDLESDEVQLVYNDAGQLVPFEGDRP